MTSQRSWGLESGCSSTRKDLEAVETAEPQHRGEMRGTSMGGGASLWLDLRSLTRYRELEWGPLKINWRFASFLCSETLSKWPIRISYMFSPVLWKILSVLFLYNSLISWILITLFQHSTTLGTFLQYKENSAFFSFLFGKKLAPEMLCGRVSKRHEGRHLGNVNVSPSEIILWLDQAGSASSPSHYRWAGVF